MKQLSIFALFSVSVISSHSLAVGGKIKDAIPTQYSYVFMSGGTTEYCIDFIGFNTVQEPLDDPLARKALAAPCEWLFDNGFT